ncbi:NifU family protein [Amycolatopsis sp. NPDC003865]
MTAARLETLLGALLAGEHRRTTEELVRELTDLYGDGLTRVVALLREHAPHLLGPLAADAAVADLLVLHDLHPLDAPARIRRALEPTGGEYAGMAAGTVRVRFEDGCPATSRAAIEAAVRAAAPDVARVELVRLYRIGMGPPEGRAS